MAVALTLALLLFAVAVFAQRAPKLPRLKVSDNGRYLTLDDRRGMPFFWLGDTAWELLKLRREEIDLYLADRAAKGFTVIQGPVIIRFMRADGKMRPDAAGELPLRDIADLATLNERYLRSFEYVVGRAAALGLRVAALPMWGEWMEKYKADDLYALGRRLGERYKDQSHLIWVAGGEAAGEAAPARVETLARGLREGGGGRQLMSVHPGGNRSSAIGRYRGGDGQRGEYNFHASPWLDFNMIQSGHFRDHDTYRIVSADYGRTPVKPTFESEYFYEDHPQLAGTQSTDAGARDGARRSQGGVLVCLRGRVRIHLRASRRLAVLPAW